jgi:hypothetical protein
MVAIGEPTEERRRAEPPECNNEGETTAMNAESKKNIKDRKRKEEELGFFPFAFTCPAGTDDTNAFGWKMIALLVGSINSGLADHWELDVVGCLPSIGTLLDSSRNSYSELRLRRKT